MKRLVILAACGASQQAGWQERAAPERHETRTVVIAPGKPIANIDAMSEQELADALAQVGDKAPAGKLALRAARLAHHRGDDQLARAMLARLATAEDSEVVDLGLAPAVGVDPSLIAVLLPMSGRYAGIGSELRAAIELAPPDGARLFFIDTKGEPDGATAAVNQAVAKGAVAILGPVGEREAVAAARAAAMSNVPIGLLAPADGADPAEGVFRLVSSAADEARAVARIAREDNFPTVAVFSPRDDVGAEEAAAFVDEAKRLGLSVTAQGTYDPTGGDVEPDVRKFLGAEHVMTHSKKYGLDRFEPEIPYTMLYIPDRYDRAAIVAAFLPYYNVELRSQDYPDPHVLQRKHHGHMPQLVQLVGSSGWHHPSLPIRGGSAVQGALVVDFFDGDLAGDAGTQFAAAFQQRTQRAATTAAAQAHDAALYMFGARKLAASATDPRAALRNALARGKLDDGACGASAIDGDGEVARPATVLEVSGDQLVVAP